jgi:hypothetical protein
MAMKERSAMMEQAKTADTQAAEAMKMAKALDGGQGQGTGGSDRGPPEDFKALNAQLAKAPKYFDDPTADPLRP